MSIPQYAWIIKALSEASSVNEKSGLFSILFEEPQPEIIEPPNFTTVPDEVRLWQTFIAIDHLMDVSPDLKSRLIQTLSDSTLSGDSQESLRQLKLKGISRIQTYIHQTLLRRPQSHFLTFVLNMYNSYLNSSPDTSPEQCAICSAQIPFKSRAIGTCANGHLFRIPCR